MKNLYLLFSLFLISGLGFAQESPFEVEWSKVYGTEAMETVSIGLKTDDNHILMGGQRQYSGNSRAAILLKTDMQGNEIWTKEYPSGDGIYISDILELPGGDVVISITTENYPQNYSPSYSVRRIKPNGQTVWSTPIQAIEGLIFNAYGIMLTQDNHILLHGNRQLAKFDLQYGNLVWLKDLPHDYYYQHETVRTYNLLFWGEKIVHFGTAAVFVLNNEGDVTEVKPFPNENFKEDLDLTRDWHFNDFTILETVIPTNDGGFFVCGIGKKSFWNSQTQEIEEENGNFGVVKKFNANLEVVYSNAYSTGTKSNGYIGPNYLKDVVELSNGNFIIVGTGTDWPNNREDRDVWMLEINSQGDMRWSTFFGGSDDDGGTYYYYGSKIIRLSDDKFIIASHSKSDDGDVPENYGNFDFWAFQVDIDRTLLEVESVTKQDIIVYPNPTKDFVNFPGSFKNISIYNSLGQKVKTMNRAEAKIDFSGFSSGIYLIYAENEEGQKQLFKIVKD